MLHGLRLSIVALILGVTAATALEPAPATAPDAQLLASLAPTDQLHGRCGTREVAELTARGLALPSALAAPGDTLYYETPEGHFRIAYQREGTVAVDTTDADLSGVPDYVELCGSAFERSWAVEIDSLGFPAPELGGERYEVSTLFGGGFFGFTSPDAGSPGGSRISVRYSMVPFCNGVTDPQACMTNALIVTVAHEFKHAIQVGAGWNIYQVGGWIELDATWIEDLVYDDSNDYYRFIEVPGSPFLDPQVSLTNASYEDCTWQHYLSENWGSDFLVEFDAELVATQSVRPAQLAYKQVASDRGLDWVDLWSDYTVATYLSGVRAVEGAGFDEAAFYPDVRTEPIASLPAEYGLLALPDMSMRFHEYTNPGGLARWLAVVEFAGGPGIGWTVQLVFQREDKTVVVPVPVVDNQAEFTSTEAVADFDRVAVLVGNSRVPSGGAASGNYALSVRLSEFTAKSSVGSVKGRFRRSAGD